MCTVSLNMRYEISYKVLAFSRLVTRNFVQLQEIFFSSIMIVLFCQPHRKYLVNPSLFLWPHSLHLPLSLSLFQLPHLHLPPLPIPHSLLIPPPYSSPPPHLSLTTCISFTASLPLPIPQAGVHRVQRVPITDGAGKVQTSTATVAVMPEVSQM